MTLRIFNDFFGCLCLLNFRVPLLFLCFRELSKFKFNLLCL